MTLFKRGTFYYLAQGIKIFENITKIYKLPESYSQLFIIVKKECKVIL